MSDRADALASEITVPFTVQRDELIITVDSFAQDGNTVTVTGDIVRDGQSIPISWPCIIVNPPTLVEDPNGEIERTYEDATTGEVTIRRLRLDPVECLIRTLIDVAGGV
jgi:hypothetical protein